MVNDSKTMMSFAYRMWPFGNHERGDSFFGNRNANTYQTYMWTETVTEIYQKNSMRNELIQQFINNQDYFNKTENQRLPTIKW